MVAYVTTTVFADRSQCCDRPDSFCPVCATDESALSRLHHVFDPNDCGHWIAVAHCFGEYCNIGICPEQQVSATGALTKSRGNFVKNEHCSNASANFPD